MIKYIHIVFIIIISLIEGVLFSQSFTLGLKAGPNFSNITGYNSIVNDYRQGININAFCLASIGRKSEGLFEIAYEQKGFKYTDQDNLNSTRTKGERFYDYLTLPVGFKYNFGETLQPYVKIGIFLAILLDANDIATETNYSVVPPSVISGNKSITYKTETIDMGIFIGFGLQYKIKSKLLIMLDANLNSGLLLVEPNQIFVEEMRHKSFLINFGLAYIFNK